jgi:hypothetical protein
MPKYARRRGQLSFRTGGKKQRAERAAIFRQAWGNNRNRSWADVQNELLEIDTRLQNTPPRQKARIRELVRMRAALERISVFKQTPEENRQRSVPELKARIVAAERQLGEMPRPMQRQYWNWRLSILALKRLLRKKQAEQADARQLKLRPQEQLEFRFE